MAKTKTVARPARRKLDTMSITVLLVMSIFGGVVGYYIGQSAANSKAVLLQEAAVMMKEKGAAMKDAGELMETRGTRNGDMELKDKGMMMTQNGSEMMMKGEGMMGGTMGY